jgi:hypothetical protein
MTPEARVNAIEAFGFTERQARFLVTVMLHSGVCVPRQYAAFAGIAYGHKVTRFFDGLADGEFVLMSDCLHNRAHLYHVTDARLYRAIGQPHSRYRRPMSSRQAIERVMGLDAIVAFPELRYLSTEDEKVAFFAGAAPSLARTRLPHLTVGTGSTQRVRLFPDDQPIGVTSTGRATFTYLVAKGGVEECRAFVQRHVDVLHALPEWTLRILFPKPVAGSIECVETAAKYELTNWLRPQLLTVIKEYFETRRATPNPRALTFEDDEFWFRTAAFDTPQFRQLYRRWLTDGDSVFESLSSPALQEALARGAGRIDSRVLLRSHQHLSPMVSCFRSCRKGVESGDKAVAPSQPRSRASAPPERPHLRRWRRIVLQARMRQRSNSLQGGSQRLDGAASCAAPDTGSERE